MNIKGTTLLILQGDLLKQPVEAIVNAANSFLKGGGGVDGAIHRAAGPELAEACRRYKQERGISNIEVGDAVLTESFEIQESNPKIRYVIHAVGPNCVVAAQNRDKENILKKAYQNSLERAREEGIRSIAFPAISTGIYGYSFNEAQRTAMKAIEEYLERDPGYFKEVRLIYYSESDFKSAQAIWDELFTKRPA
ncbi:MAG: macro domain-containing protein [Chlamydiales bacterium]|nr:macro domain-containing protein [Chlamydiales bacterium]